MTCFVATTPWAGNRLLCEALAATGAVGTPADYFNPTAVALRGREWGLPRSTDGRFAAAYLAAARSAATGANGVGSADLPWSNLRWLVRIARIASAPDSPAAAGSDAEAVAAWFPQPRYVHLRCRDTTRQALRWHDGLHAGLHAGPDPQPEPDDFQEVRWLETLLLHHERSWRTYFQIHGIAAMEVEYEAFLAKPGETVGAILQWLGLPFALPLGWTPPPGAARRADPERDARLERYLGVRGSLGTTVGVRAEVR